MEEEIIEEVQKLQSLGEFDILQNITNSQNQNGFKQGDYHRYRNYCQKKVLRIRNQIKFKYGRGKYQSKDIISEKTNEPRVIEVLLFQAERNWSFALAMKSSLQNTQLKQNENRRKKFHIRKKFAKAIHYACQLDVLCGERCGDKTGFEAKAYHKYLSGQYLLERKNYQEAQKDFILSRTIWKELMGMSDSYQQVVFQDKLDQLEQSIRYCSHQLTNGAPMMSIEDILSLKQKGTDDVVLVAKLDQMLAESRAQKLSTLTHRDVIFQAEKLQISNLKILNCMQKMDEQDYNLKSASGFEEKMAIYLDVFGALDEVTCLLAKEKEEQMDQEVNLQLVNKKQGYFVLQKQQYVYQRNYLQFLQAQERFINEGTIDALDTVLSKRQLKTKLIQPLEMIRWSENLLSAVRQVQEMQKSHVDFGSKKELEFEETIFRNIRCIYIGCLYYQNKHFLEAASLFQYIETLFQNSKGYYQSTFQLKFDFDEVVKQKMEQIGYYKSKAIAHLQEQRIQSEQEVEIGMQQVNLEGKVSQKTLEQYMNSNENVSALINHANLQKMPIAESNPELKMLSARPIFLDLAYSQLKYPSVEKKIQQDEGLMKKVFSRFSIWGK